MKSFPFNSQIESYDDNGLPVYDRAADSDILASMLARFFANGIVRDGAGTLGFYVTPGANALETQVTPGYVIINGRCGDEEDTQTFTHAAPDATYDRIDRIILRMSLEINERQVSMYMKTGTPSASPVAPALTRNQSVWELAAADVRIRKNVSTITQANITDLRLNTDLCGVSEIPLTVFNTTELYSQVQGDLAQFKANEQAAFLAWVASIQDILDEDAAGNLLNLINQRLPLAGGTMTGLIRFNSTESPAQSGVVGIGSTGTMYMEHRTNDEQDNYLILTGSDSRVGKPWGISYGGTGATTAAAARSNLGITPANIGAAPTNHDHALTSMTGTLNIAKGGTGASSAADARTALGITPANIGAVTKKTATASLAVASWNTSKQQTVSVTGVTANNTIIVTPAPASYVHYHECAVRCTAQGNGTLTFTCTDTPTSALTVNVVIFD